MLKLKMLNFEEKNEFDFIHFNKCVYYLRHVIQNVHFFITFHINYKK